MIVDVVTYNGEADLLEIRLNILDEYVDKFVIVEFDKTFSGKDKPSYYLRDEERFKFWWPKIEYHRFYDLQYNKYMALAESSPNTKGADHWKREFCQKESIKDALKGLKDDDVVFIGDVDEIWSPEVIKDFDNPILSATEKLKLRVYTYYLNNRSSEEFWGCRAFRYKFIKGEDKILNHERQSLQKNAIYRGWHFTSMWSQLPRKLTDSYTKESYATEAVLSNLANNIKENKDFLGRNFTYTIDESDWPPWLTRHRQDYKHMLK